MGEGETIGAAVRSLSRIPTSMGQQRGIQGIPNRPYPPHLELTLHMLPGMPSMAICLLRARHRHSRRNTKVSWSDSPFSGTIDSTVKIDYCNHLFK